MAERYLTIDWARLHRDACALAELLAAAGPWRGIVAVARGGLVPAAIVARELDCRLVESVCVAAYQGETLGVPVLLKAPDAAGDGAGFVVIDDLVDTGTTLRLVQALLPQAVCACLYAKPAGQSLVTYRVADVAQDTWIVLPWDTHNLSVRSGCDVAATG